MYTITQQLELSNGQIRCQEVWGVEASDGTIAPRAQCVLPGPHRGPHTSPADESFSDSECVMLRCDECPCSYAFAVSDVGRPCGDLERWWAAGCPNMRPSVIHRTFGCKGRKIISFENTVPLA